jgi:hypothetical protein
MRGVAQYRVHFGARGVALVCILALAAALRVYRLEANLPDYPGWDEPEIVERAFAVGGGDLNPHRFRWPGSLLIYANTIVFAAYYVAGTIGGWFDSLRDFQKAYQNDPTVFYVLARLLNVAAALATIGLVFRATAGLGLLASATAVLLIAVSPVHVRESALAGTDVPASLFLLAALLTARSFLDKPTLALFVLSGLLLGLGAAIKYYVVVGAVGIAFAAWSGRLPALGRMRLLAAAGISAAVGFLIGCPFSVLAFQEFSDDLAYEAAHQARGHLGFDPEGNPAVWYVRNSLLPALGLPALIGACWGLVMIGRHHRRFLTLVVTAAAYFAFITLSNVSFRRYAVPHVALLSIAAAVTVWQLRGVPVLAWLVAASMVAVPARGALGVATERGKEDTRAAAARWLHANVPASARVLTSHDGPRFPATVKVSRFSPISQEHFGLVESGQIDVFALMSSSTVAMQREIVLRNHPQVAKSHLRLYDWVKTHATLQAVFHPGPHHKGDSVEVYLTRTRPDEGGAVRSQPGLPGR